MDLSRLTARQKQLRDRRTDTERSLPVGNLRSDLLAALDRCQIIYQRIWNGEDIPQVEVCDAERLANSLYEESRLASEISQYEPGAR